MKKLLLLTALFGFGLSSSFAQSAAETCITATPVCASTAVTYPSTSTGVPAEVGPYYGCLASQPNPSWFYFRIESAGNIIIDISQMASGTGVDVDFIIWGPFTSPTAPCAGGLTMAAMESCSYSSSYMEIATVDSALVGEYYIMLITNFSGMPADVTFSVNPASNGAISCTETCVTNATFNSPLCVGATMQLNATNHLGLGTYTWTGPAGFTSSLENPTISGVDGTNSGFYYLNYTRDTTCNYTDTVYVSVDTCGTLTGNLYGDLNANCAMDTAEASIGNVQMKLTQSGSFVGYAWTDVFGFYYFDVPPGIYTIEVVPDASFPITCPGSLAHTTTVLASTTTTENFAVDCGSLDVAAFGVAVSGIAFFPGVTNQMYPVTASLGPDCSTTPVPGEFMLVLDPLVSYAGPYSSYPGPSSIVTAATGDTLKWTVADVTDIGYYGYLDFPFMYTTNVTATIGDTVHFTAIILPMVGDIDPGNNIYECSYIVGNSYDPNSKEVSPRGDGPSGFIPANTPSLEYTINFQNMGTAPAHNIFILDTLDANVDVATLHIITSSHLMTTTMMPGNILKFNFSNIMLADSASNEPMSHGFVKYSIAPVAGLTPGDQIMNTAHIYFDFNPAVVTNTAINTIEFPSGINEYTEYQLGLYPNPTNGSVNVVFEDKLSQEASIRLTNVAGQLIWEEGTTNMTNGKYVRTIDLSSEPKGVYLIEIKTDKQVVHKKIVRN